MSHSLNVTKYFVTSVGGACWFDVVKNTRLSADATTLLAINVTKEQCCQMDPTGEKYYSNDGPGRTDQTWQWQFFQSHQCVLACNGKFEIVFL